MCRQADEAYAPCPSYTGRNTIGTTQEAAAKGEVPGEALDNAPSILVMKNRFFLPPDRRILGSERWDYRPPYSIRTSSPGTKR